MDAGIPDGRVPTRSHGSRGWDPAPAVVPATRPTFRSGLCCGAIRRSSGCPPSRLLGLPYRWGGTDSLDANRLFVGVTLSFYRTTMVAAPLVLLRLRCLAGAPALVLTCGLVLTGSS